MANAGLKTRNKKENFSQCDWIGTNLGFYMETWTQWAKIKTQIKRLSLLFFVLVKGRTERSLLSGFLANTCSFSSFFSLYQNEAETEQYWGIMEREKEERGEGCDFMKEREIDDKQWREKTEVIL